jgi:aspartate/methionine/tyrosine aminotransferase
MGCRIKEAQLRPEDNWRLNLHELEAIASSKTKLISIVNPNNPTGSILTREEMQRIINLCARTGAWLHADEVYRGTELSGPETPSFWGMYDRVICVNSLSKAYGLAGLRIGWAIASPEMVEELWRRHEYAVIAAAGPSMKLAEIALRADKRARLLERQKKLSREGHELLQSWVKKQEGRFSVRPAVATSIAFVRCHFDVSSVDFANQLRQKASVLVAPGAYLGTEHHLRITVGYEPAKVSSALERIGVVAAELARTNIAAQA